MLQPGVADLSHAMVAIGSDLAASLMTLMVLSGLGVKAIRAKAKTPDRNRIVQRIGAHHAVFPEAEMGAPVAHLIAGRMSRLADRVRAIGDDRAVRRRR